MWTYSSMHTGCSIWSVWQHIPLSVLLHLPAQTSKTGELSSREKCPRAKLGPGDWLLKQHYKLFAKQEWRTRQFRCFRNVFYGATEEFYIILKPLWCNRGSLNPGSTQAKLLFSCTKLEERKHHAVWGWLLLGFVVTTVLGTREWITMMDQWAHWD